MHIAFAVIMLMVILEAGHASACTLHHEQRRTVAQITGGDTLVLDTGEVVKLVGALPPPTSDPWLSPSALSRHIPHEAATHIGSARGSVETATRDALADLVAGRPVDIAMSGRRKDRYGRLLAHLFLAGDAPTVGGVGGADGAHKNPAATKWVQGQLVADGWARAYALPGSTACLQELMEAEQIARAGSRGHWASGLFVDRDAVMIRDLMGLADTFQTVTGTLVNLAEGRGDERGATVLMFEAPRTFETPRAAPLNGMGRDRFDGSISTQAMTVVVPSALDRANEAAASAALAARAASGQQGRVGPRYSKADWRHLIHAEVRVRGWIEATAAGPRIVLTDLREIEILNSAKRTPPWPAPATLDTLSDSR